MNPAVIVILLLAFAGMCCAAVGVFLLFGAGWCLIATAWMCFAAAAFLRRGLS